MPGMLMKLGWLDERPPSAHQRADGGGVGEFDEFGEFGRSVAEYDAAAGVDERALGFPDELRGAADLAGVAFGEDFIAGQVDGVDGHVVAAGLENVLRDIDQHGAGAAAGGEVEGFVDDLRKFRERLHHEVVLRGGAGDAEGVGFLEGVAADELGVHLAGDGDQRDGIHHGVDQSGNQVGGAGAGGGAADADLAGGAGIAFGGEAGVLFVADEDVADVVIVEGVVEGDGDAAGVTEEAVHAFADEAFEEHFGSAHELAEFSRLAGAG